MTNSDRLTKSAVDALPTTGSEHFVWDAELKGFGVRVSAKGAKSYVVQCRVGGGRGGRFRRIKLGTHPTMTAEKARAAAKEKLAQAQLSKDPAEDRERARQAETVADLVKLWLNEGVQVNRRTGALKSQRNIDGERGRVEAHVLPLLGARRLSELSRADIEVFRDRIIRGATNGVRKTRPRGRARVRGGKGTAARTVRMLSSMLSFGVDRDLLPTNPARGVRLPPGEKMQRFLSSRELQQLHRLGVGA